MAVGEAAEQRAVLALASFRSAMAFLPQASKSVVGHVGARRHRALHHVEGRLECRRHDRRGQLDLRGPAVVADLEHDELVGVEGHVALRAGEAEAEEVRARLLAGVEELALGPVAHDLHAGLALDHHGGGQVPVAAGEVGVDIAAQLRHVVEHLLHRVGAERRRVEIDHRLLVELGAAGGEHDAVEDRGVLPGLAAMGERR